MLTTRKITLAT